MPAIEFGKKMKRFAEEVNQRKEAAAEVVNSPQTDVLDQEENVEPENNLETPQETVVVNKREFYRLAYALVLGNPQIYLGISGMKRIGEMLGAKTYEDSLNVWQEIKDYIHRGV